MRLGRNVDESMIDVVIVHYETPQMLRRCVTSVREFGDAFVRSITVVDNSVSESGRDGARAVESTEVSVVRPESNVGYGTGANRGAVLGSAQRLLILNADTEVTPGALRAMSAALDMNPAVGVVGPRLMDEAGRTHPSCAEFPTVWSTLVHQSGVWQWLPIASLAKRARPFFTPPGSAVVPWVLGAALLFDRGVFDEAGGFDEAYFLYFEEVDLLRRLADRGVCTMYVADATVRHVGGASTADHPLASQRPMYRSVARFMAVHHSPAAAVGLRCAVVTIAAGRLLRDSVVAVVRCDRRSTAEIIRTWLAVGWDAARGWNR